MKIRNYSNGEQVERMKVSDKFRAKCQSCGSTCVTVYTERSSRPGVQEVQVYLDCDECHAVETLYGHIGCVDSL